LASYKVVITTTAQRDLERLDRETKARIGQRLKLVSAEPLKMAKKLSDPKIGTYRFRVGDYRIIFDLAGEELIVLRVGHRRDIYR
jgi:mRNA interferase RelE/StbE